MYRASSSQQKASSAVKNIDIPRTDVSKYNGSIQALFSGSSLDPLREVARAKYVMFVRHAALVRNIDTGHAPFSIRNCFLKARPNLLYLVT